MRFPLTPTQIVRGQLVGAEVAYGELSLAGEGDVPSSPVGSDGAFEFMNLAPGDWVGAATFAGGSCSAVLHVLTRPEEYIQDLGVIQCNGTDAVGAP